MTIRMTRASMANARPRPWGGIQVPSSGIGARRVDPRHPLDFFWIRNDTGRIGLMLRLLDGPPSLPFRVDLAGVDVAVRQDPVEGTSSLLLLLQDAADSDLFAALGSDLLDSTAAVGDTTTGFAVVMRRLQRWQALLSRPRHHRLAAAELQGLFGELSVLDRVLMPWLGPQATVESWRGPLGEPQDFCTGSTAIEVKALLGTGRQEVHISSADQLEASLQNLLLAVVTLSVASEDTGASLPEIVLSLRTRFGEAGATPLEAFNDRLLAVGYADLDEYHEHRFSVERFDWFRVEGAFPRIRPSAVPGGVSRVSYMLSLLACESFRSTPPGAAVP
jgi:hypothetical protein